MEYENNNYSSKAVGTAGLTTGIIGTALGVMSNNLLGGFVGGNNQYVSKETYDVQLALIEANKQNAILAADLGTEKKLVETYEAMNSKVANVRDELSARIYNLENTVNSNAAAQSVINCNMSNNIGILQSQVEQLTGMTKLVIPSSNVFTPTTTQ